MPASSVNLYHMQDAKNNFNAVRPIPVCDESNYFTTPSHNIHVSTNCYYGYHEPMPNKHVEDYQDCEMKEVKPNDVQIMEQLPSNGTARKRVAEDYTHIQNKRLCKDTSSMCSLVGTLSSPSHSASAFNVNITKFYVLFWKYKAIVTTW